MGQAQFCHAEHLVRSGALSDEPKKCLNVATPGIYQAEQW
jgi:hypothetical protein